MMAKRCCKVHAICSTSTTAREPLVNSEFVMPAKVEVQEVQNCGTTTITGMTALIDRRKALREHGNSRRQVVSSSVSQRSAVPNR
jgi:hypothetical protein